MLSPQIQEMWYSSKLYVFMAKSTSYSYKGLNSKHDMRLPNVIRASSKTFLTTQRQLSSIHKVTKIFPACRNFIQQQSFCFCNPKNMQKVLLKKYSQAAVFIQCGPMHFNCVNQKKLLSNWWLWDKRNMGTPEFFNKWYNIALKSVKADQRCWKNQLKEVFLFYLLIHRSKTTFLPLYHVYPPHIYFKGNRKL